MATYVTPPRFAAVSNIPLSLPQTELRRAKQLQIAIVPLALNEHFELHSLTLHLLRILTPGVAPRLNNTSLGLASVGVYLTSMLTGSAALVRCRAPGAISHGAPSRFNTPGLHRIIVSNNSSNVDLAVVVTGAAKKYGR